MNDHTDKPDLELVELVRESLAGLARLGGWVVLKDVEQVMVERIKSSQNRARQHGEDLQLAIARQNAANKEAVELREKVKKLQADLAEAQQQALGAAAGAGSLFAVAEKLREEKDALVAQLEEEERMVKRLREVVLGTPKGIVLGDVRGGQRYLGTFQKPNLPEDWTVGTKLALVRLSPDGLELAGEVDNKEGADA